MLKQAESLEWQRSLATAVFPKLEAKDRRKQIEAAKAVGYLGKRRRSAMELVDVETRVRMIGQMLASHGERWAKHHRSQVDWLQKQGITRDQAMALQAAWLQQERSNGFWR